MRTAHPAVTGTVTSADGTTIAYERAGSGPALILVDCAGRSRAWSSFGGLIGPLAAGLAVYHYDRRGRGSTDTAPYAVQREVEDLAALIERAGGEASLYGYSSGGLLALHAVADGLPVRKLALLEPPIERDEDRTAQRAFTADLAALLEAGRHADAVEYYLNGIGVPDEILVGMRGTPAWEAMEAVAPTLRYDSLLSEATPFPLLARVTAPTLVLDSEGSGEELTAMAATVAGGLPRATRRSLAGEWHGVPDDVLAPVLLDFFRR